MPTTNQLIRKGRRPKRRRAGARALEGCPQRKGTVLRAYVVKPKKPNAGLRKMVRVRLTNGHEITAGIPGIGHNLQEHANVLIRGGRTKDCPGVKYRVVRGVLDCDGAHPETGKGGETFPRNKARSRYGVKRPKA